MTSSQIVEQLCNHEISKEDAIKEIESIRKGNLIRFIVDGISSATPDNHGYLKLKLPYQYFKIENALKKGDSVDVSFITD